MAKPKTVADRLVRCADCRHFQRDTEGRSRTVDTHEYFMGQCAEKCDPDHTRNDKTGVAKAFADKLRKCNKYKPR